MLVRCNWCFWKGPEKSIIYDEKEDVEKCPHCKESGYLMDVQPYKEGKERAREKAMEWQEKARESNYSYGDIAEAGNHFYKLGKRYGLLKEFRENGIPC